MHSLPQRALLVPCKSGSLFPGPCIFFGLTNFSALHWFSLAQKFVLCRLAWAANVPVKRRM